MSLPDLPPNLRVLCHLLSNTSAAHLPRILPVLLRHVVCCRGALSVTPAPSKTDSSESAVLVHKLKTQISTLLYGKSAEGRFVAASLIKSVVETGGWEVLRGVEYWVRGLLAILSKKDTVATMRICILALTKIYLMTHQYQSLVREITTPTLPTFVSSCLRLVSSQPSGTKQSDPPLSLMESVFDAFSALLPRHPAIFRPSTKQIHHAILPCLAPTISDSRFVPSSLIASARRLKVHLYQTAAKNAGGEEWTKGVRGLVMELHQTTDLVYRPVIEDWESAAGYISQSVDVNEELRGGGQTETHFPPWTGMGSGLERLAGLLGLMGEHFRLPTSTAVAIPMGAIIDLLTRILSVAALSTSKGASNHGAVRLNPAIERSEREELFCGLPGVHVATMQVYMVLAARLGTNFTSLAHGTLDQVIWVFPAGSFDERFRAAVYRLVSSLLPLIGSSLPKTTVTALVPILKSCITEFQDNTGAEQEANGKSATTTNFDHFLVKDGTQSALLANKGVEVMDAASALLPLLLSHLPHQHLREQYRAELDRTAILSGHRDAMVASVLNPFTRKNGTTFYSILPHLSRLFPGDEAVELSLRPRASMVARGGPSLDEITVDEELPELPMEGVVASITYNDIEESIVNNAHSQANKRQRVEEPTQNRINLWDQSSSVQQVTGDATIEKGSAGPGSVEANSENLRQVSALNLTVGDSVPSPAPLRRAEPARITHNMENMEVEGEDDDSGESVHLNMEMSDSEEEEDDDDDDSNMIG